MGGEDKMKRRIESFYLVPCVIAVLSFALGLLIDARLILIAVYVMMHLFFGPLDWYLFYKLYLKIKEVIR